MAALGLEILGVTLATLGWIVGIVSCALPMWRVTAFIGSNIVTAQIIWQGIWMDCVVQSTGQMQCKVYDSMLALPQDLQAARALCVIAIMLGVLGVLVSVAGAKCTNCIEDERTKAKVIIAAGVTFICAAVMELIPVSWSAHTIIMDFYNPVITEAQKREIGASLYLGWAAAALLLTGGAILCCSCPPSQEKSSNSGHHLHKLLVAGEHGGKSTLCSMLIASPSLEDESQGWGLQLARRDRHVGFLSQLTARGTSVREQDKLEVSHNAHSRQLCGGADCECFTPGHPSH
ncbi:Claudin-4 [Bagarius yarrelli]|uniref:Claudin-4 n=1 Tax=Bagarius yarrelli TaxID=175774 RepID=A0A556UY75_BAGYA|nr:Claudin-4 [Bagarius yarrelli]